MHVSRFEAGLQGLGQSTGDDYQTVSTSAGDYQVINGVTYDPNGNVVTNPQVLSSAQMSNINTQNYTQGQLNASTCPAGSTCSIIPGMANSTVGIAGAFIALFIVIAALGGHAHGRG